MIAPAALAARLLHPSVTFAALLLFMYCLRSWQQRSGRHLTAKPKAEAASRDDTLVLNCKAWRRPAGLHTAPGITPALSCRRSRDQAVSEPLSSRFLLRGGVCVPLLSLRRTGVHRKRDGTRNKCASAFQSPRQHLGSKLIGSGIPCECIV